jgi:hypothetical protein
MLNRGKFQASKRQFKSTSLSQTASLIRRPCQKSTQPIADYRFLMEIFSSEEDRKTRLVGEAEIRSLAGDISSNIIKFFLLFLLVFDQNDLIYNENHQSLHRIK